jgi:hypothetical protein
MAQAGAQLGMGLAGVLNKSKSKAASISIIFLSWSVLVRSAHGSTAASMPASTMQHVLSLCCCCRYTGHTLAKFIITIVSGVLTGVFAVALSSSVGALTEWKLHTIQSLLDGPGSHKIWMAFLWHWAYSCVLVVFAVALVSVQLPSMLASTLRPPAGLQLTRSCSPHTAWTRC